MSLAPILVTGAHRSGTTWVGRMLAEARPAAYIHEPFHIHHHPGVCGAAFDRWFTCIRADNAAAFYEDIEKCINLHYNLAAEIRAGNLPGQWRRIARQYVKYILYRTTGARAVIKDPLALFSAEWLAATFNMKVVVMIRHPAAFAGSLKKAGWSHPFHHFLAQPLLMQNYLEEFRDEIAWFAKAEQPIMDQAAFLWKLTNSVVLRLKRIYPEWIFVRHEDVSREPAICFKDIFTRLSLPWSSRLERIISYHSRPGNPVEQIPGGNMIVRDSSANIQAWKTRLTQGEVQRIHDAVKDLSGCFYCEDEW